VAGLSENDIRSELVASAAKAEGSGAPPPTPGPLMSQLQLRHYLDQLNGMSAASGNGTLPPS